MVDCMDALGGCRALVALITIADSSGVLTRLGKAHRDRLLFADHQFFAHPALPFC